MGNEGYRGGLKFVLKSFEERLESCFVDRSGFGFFLAFGLGWGWGWDGGLVGVVGELSVELDLDLVVDDGCG